MKFPIIQGRPDRDEAEAPVRTSRPRKPEWLKVKAPGGARYSEIASNLKGLRLVTVCREAHCPNMGECWGGGTATIMLMGEVCTRGCRFCAVKSGRPDALDPDEPDNAAEAVVAMGVDYVVLTSVNRDDLPDGGAAHFAATVRALRRHKPEIMVETLIGDFQGDMTGVDLIVEAGPEVIAHNVETVRRLTRTVRDARADFDVSLAVLSHIREAGAGRGPGGADILAKSSVMLGLGEGEAEVLECLEELRDAGCQVVTFGQYLQPSAKHLDVVEYVPPARFDRFAEIAREMGFLYVASGPLVRSSYRAGEYYLAAHIEEQRTARGQGPS